MKSPKILAGIAGAIIVIALISTRHAGNSSDASATPQQSAHITVLRGRTSDNSCIENDGEARVYVTITLRNNGDTAGEINPWATFDYSDGGHSQETYLSNYGEYLTVPAHTEVDATFYHTFNPQQHAMIRCAGYADLGSNTPGYYLPMR